MTPSAAPRQRWSQRGRTGGGNDACRSREAVITGRVLQVIRESLGLSQAQLAERLAVDANTLQSWESGRRGLTGTRVGVLAQLRRELHLLGAPAAAIRSIDPAIEADYLLRVVIDEDPRQVPDLRRHPLATSVLHRDVIDLLAWPLTQALPTTLPPLTLPRHGPAPSAPSLTAGERDLFFAHLRVIVERSRRLCAGDDFPQPHRQIYYLMQWDRRDESRAWVEAMERAERRAWRPSDRWTPRWVTARSAAITQARHGDREPLREFIADGLRDCPPCQDADLNYWAYWLDELADVWRSDADMAEGLLPWSGEHMLTRFTDRLMPEEPLLDLYAHSTRALIQRRPRLLEQRRTAVELGKRVEHLLDADSLVPSTRRTLEDLRFGVQLADR